MNYLSKKLRCFKYRFYCIRFFYCVLVIALASCKTPKNEAIDLGSIETVQSIDGNFEYHLDYYKEFNLDSVLQNDFENLNYISSESDIITKPYYPVVIKIDCQQNASSLLDDEPLVLEFCYPFLHNAKLVVKLKNGQLIEIKELKESTIYDKRYYSFEILKKRSEIKTIYLITRSYSGPIFTDVYIWNKSFYESNITTVSKYGFLLGLYGILYIILMLLLFKNRTPLFIGIGAFITANLFHFLADGGWLRAVFPDTPLSNVWLEFLTYSAKFLIAYAGLYICAVIFKKHKFPKYFLLINYTLIIFLTYNVITDFYYTVLTPNYSVSLEYVFVLYCVLFMIAYVIAVLTYAYVKSKENIYLWMIIFSSVHLIGFVVLVFRSLQIIPYPFSYYLSNKIVEYLPIIHYHPVIMDVGMFVEIGGITLIVFLNMFNSIEFSHKVKRDYDQVSSNLEQRLQAVGSKQKKYFDRIINENIIKKLNHFKTHLHLKNIGNNDEKLIQQLTSLEQSLHELAPNNDFSIANASDIISNYFKEHKEAYSKINFKTFNLSLFNQLPVYKREYLFDIIIEATNNTINHAKCKNVMLNFELEEEFLIMTYSDDGKGIPRKKSKSKGIGLVIIENNVAAMKGEFLSVSELSKGTAIRVKIHTKE